jgi:hypothetical protein
MVALGIGVKVATLPVIALGVGVGVDYALYLLSVQLAQQRDGVPLALAYKRAVLFTGKVVALVGSPWPPASSPGPGRRSSSRPTWASCSPSCSCGTCWARWC